MISIILSAQLILWVVISGLFIASRRASIFHPFTWYLVFHGLVFVIRPMVAHIFDFQHMYYLMGFYPTDDEIQFTIVLTFVALIFFGVASCLLVPTVPDFDRPIQIEFDRFERRAFAVLLIFALPIALYSAAMDVMSAGVTPPAEPLMKMRTDFATGATIHENSNGYIAGIQVFLGTICLMLIWVKKFRRWTFVPLAFYLADRAYVGDARWTIVLTILSLGLLYLVSHRRRWPSVLLLVLAIPVYGGFQLIGEERDVFRSWITGKETTAIATLVDQSWIERQDNPDFANFEFLTYLVDIVPNRTDTYGYFSDFLQLFTEPVPRVLWPDKPVGSPIQLLNVNDYGNFVGWTYSLVGMGWVSLGWIGVAILMTVVGYILALVHRWYWRGAATNVRILTYCLFLPLTIQWFRDGDISIAKFVLFVLSPIFIWRGLTRLLRSPMLASFDSVPLIGGRPRTSNGFHNNG
jgi:hypothetical protein